MLHHVRMREMSINHLQSSASSRICKLADGRTFAVFARMSVNEWGEAEPQATADFTRRLVDNVLATGEIRDLQVLKSITLNSFQQCLSTCDAVDPRWITCSISCAILDHVGATGLITGEGAYLWCSKSQPLSSSIPSGPNPLVDIGRQTYEQLRNALWQHSTDPFSSFEIRWDLNSEMNLLFLSDQTVCRELRASNDFARFCEDGLESSLVRDLPGVVIHAR